MDTEPQTASEANRTVLAHQAHTATTLGTVGTIGAIVSGVALATIAPAVGITLSAVGAVSGAYFLWSRMHAESQMAQQHPQESAIDFAALWKEIPQPSHAVWKYSTPTPGRHKYETLRELYQLLCGAFAHFELAAKLGDFSTKNVEGLLSGSPLPWEDWLNQTHGLSVQSTESQLTIQYNFRMSPIARQKIFIQTLLLADGALRLAGAWLLLQEGRDIRKTLHFSCPTPILDDPRTILSNDGDIDSSALDPAGNLSPANEEKKQVLIILAFRDSFMHGEIDSDKRKRVRFREKWISGSLNKPNIPYSPAVIAEACKELPIRPIRFQLPEFRAARRESPPIPAVVGCLPVTLTRV